ncbi:hypothetical protein AX17_005143 [Amanita inopinata Kibby_2008]|nr:hypothetical protein AX17_005143 [Amanita inopinata Kibby_2008]
MSLTFDNIQTVAESTINALRHLGYNSCIVGSVGCYLWGMRNRVPQDVDIVVLDLKVDPEEIKRQIIAADNRFYLVGPQDLHADYKVLWFRLTGSSGQHIQCKVDILKPKEGLAIPNVPVERIIRIKNYANMPVMPFVPLLYLKVQAWRHHQTSDKAHFRVKVPQDERDINEMLNIAVDRKDLGFYRRSDVSSWMPNWIDDIGKRHVEQHKRDHPETAASWDIFMS